MRATLEDVPILVPCSSSRSILTPPELKISYLVIIPFGLFCLSTTGYPENPSLIIFIHILDSESSGVHVLTFSLINSLTVPSGISDGSRLLKISMMPIIPLRILPLAVSTTGMHVNPVSSMILAACFISVSAEMMGVSMTYPLTVIFDFVDVMFRTSFSVIIPITLFFSSTTGNVLWWKSLIS